MERQNCYKAQLQDGEIILTRLLAAKIMDDFTMPILISNIEENGTKQEQSFLSWVRKDIKFVSNHTKAAYLFYQKLLNDKLVPDNPSIIEYFAGAGIHAVIAEELLFPRRHICLDRNALAVEQLRLVSKNYPYIWVLQREFEDYSEHHRDDIFDIHDLDNPNFTAAQIRHSHIELSRIFNSKPLVVKLTDVAGTKMCWNRKYFVKQFRQDFHSYEGYLDLMSRRLYDLFGYSISFGYTYDGVALLCLIEGNHVADLRKLEYDEKGFVLNENEL